MLQIWHAWAVAWDTDNTEDSEHQQAVLTLASAALPDCVMFAFALADVLQAHKQEAAALQVYEVRTLLPDRPRLRCADRSEIAFRA